VARETGILEDWHDARGFGFIRRPDGSKIYVHMKSIGKSIDRPKPGDRLSYEIGEGAGGRPAAIKARIIDLPPSRAASGQDKAGRPPTAAGPPSTGAAPAGAPASADTPGGLRSISVRTATAATIIAMLANNLLLGRFGFWVGLLYVVGGWASWMLYAADKRAAAKREWRAPERRLHLADLAFGIVGGLLAQHALRHKTYKPGFVTVTGMISALHILTLGLIMLGVYAPGGVGDFFRAYFTA
jgi:uncharacterized membrane protein YsdA (DUF1294 family)/cold shock CspA family protein